MKDNIIEFQNVSFTYESEDAQRKAAVRNASFRVKRGEFVAVVGHNGSGKSTLAKLTNAILIPNSGTVLVNGMDTSDQALTFDIRKTVGMVFQNPDNQIVATIVEDDVAFGPENLGVPPMEIRKRVDDALQAVGMYQFRGYEPHRLSGGQKQRVAIAGVMAMQTACMVFDESTAMLDPRGRREVMDTVRKLNQEQGITILLITHFMEEAVEANRVIVIDNGEILLEGTPREVFRQVEKIKSVGLDVPQTAELTRLLRMEGLPLPQDALTVEECIEMLWQAAGGCENGNY